MIRAFRNLRIDLLERKNFQRYILFALGEIILVIIGILVALQVDNWNNDRKGRNELHATLDQVYTIFDRDLDRLIALRGGYLKQIAMIDSVKSSPSSIDPKVLPYMLYYIDLGYASLSTEVSSLVSDLNLNSDDVQQRNLAKAISEYERNFSVTTYFTKEYLTPILNEQQLPQPSLIYQLSDQDNFGNVDRNFFDDEEVKIVLGLLEKPLLQRALKSARSQKEMNIKILDFNIGIIKAKKVAVKDFYPDVVLLYRNIGLIGSGTEHNNWEDDVDLIATDRAMEVWEADVYLRDGFVKFREGDDWTINWGASGHGDGNAILYGYDIKVQQGRYHLVFNLSNRTYKFTQISP